ncbi:type I phosphodiesterase/nucleotide pyrophosphatase [Pseudonocardia sediminis]|uniref:Type I phosphodiesterase/nucleotide pyrophosphatase n=1 Tax=Pseudonocardia sediminis TaxID=1397368 RepID=A0A4Q7V4Z1_PSEST|nr:alkaline phosphatase family protein [Pseudonocardia sediminis]RZT88621.1 type I phosphodiesterase/nucleotide pyrophosphatase [Pseudonocardia sediminis]
MTETPESLLPRYGAGTLSDVLPALLTSLGTGIGTDVGAFGLPPSRAAGLLLIDGLGHELLAAHAADAPVLAAMADAGPLTVGFPSSTPISLTSLGTGLPPGAHGTLGVRFRVEDTLLDALSWRDGGTDLRERLVPERVQPEPTLFERAAAAGVEVTVVSGREFRTSGLTRSGLRGGTYRGVHALGDLATAFLDGLTGPGPRLAYGYHSELDLLGHVHGPGSAPWRWQLRLLDHLVEMLLDGLPAGALLAVTGDHGMVGLTRVYDADDDDDVLRDGVTLLGGDPRARQIYTSPGAADEVLATWRETLGDDAWVLPGQEAVDRNWFGPVTSGMRDRVGDVVAAMRGTAGVVRSEAEPMMAGLPGQHGSFSTAEQLVPLLVASSP